MQLHRREHAVVTLAGVVAPVGFSHSSERSASSRFGSFAPTTVVRDVGVAAASLGAEVGCAPDSSTDSPLAQIRKAGFERTSVAVPVLSASKVVRRSIAACVCLISAASCCVFLSQRFDLVSSRLRGGRPRTKTLRGGLVLDQVRGERFDLFVALQVLCTSASSSRERRNCSRYDAHVRYSSAARSVPLAGALVACVVGRNFASLLLDPRFPRFEVGDVLKRSAQCYLDGPLRPAATAPVPIRRVASASASTMHNCAWCILQQVHVDPVFGRVCF